MANRTLGWVQNPNRLDKLKNVVSIFTDSSFKGVVLTYKLPVLLKNGCIEQRVYDEIFHLLTTTNSYPYDILKGKGCGQRSRADALCSGIIQVSLDGTLDRRYIDLDDKPIIIKKLYTDDWTADGYLRWAIATGFIQYNRATDKCSITKLGTRLANSKDGSAEEYDCFTKALLSYPPLIRVLGLLEKGEAKTKFELGDKFGFKEELGFTSVPQDMYTFEYFNAHPSRRSEIRSNLEGDSDKYVRTICNWMKQMNWIQTTKKVVRDEYFNQDVKLQAYKITPAGKRALQISRGNSSNPRMVKNVSYEMLSSNKSPNADYLRMRRALIINALGSPRDLPAVVAYLNKNGLSEDVVSVKDEIEGLKNIGLEFEYINGKYKLLDKLNDLEVPVTTVQIDELTEVQNRVRSVLKTLNHNYLSLINIAFWNNTSTKNENARNFEIETARLFKDLGFFSIRLGDANRPDVIISDKDNGTIIDNKAYSDGFMLSVHDSDEMARYVTENKKRVPGVPANEWWKNFNDEVKNFTFLFISSFLKGSYETNLRNLSIRTGVTGAAIGIENLLYLAEQIKSGLMSRDDFFKLFDNKELISYF